MAEDIFIFILLLLLFVGLPVAVILIVVSFISCLVLFKRVKALETKLDKALKSSLRQETIVVKEEEQKEAAEAPEHVHIIKEEKPEKVFSKEETSTPEKELKEKPIKSQVKADKPSKPLPISKDKIESFIGSRLLNFIGAISLIIGVGFFFTYAIAQGWISEPLRILMGIALGGGLLGAGHHFNRKDFSAFAQGLAGTGIAVLYLSVFTAYEVYQLINYPVAIALMITVTILSFFQSLYYNSIVIGLIGLTGGFLTPFIVQSKNPQDFGYFLYLTFINIWCVLILLKKPTWRLIEYIGIFTTFILYYLWAISVLEAGKFALPMCFITVIWLMYYSNNLVRLAKKDDNSPLNSLITNGAALLLYIFSAYTLFEATYKEFHGLHMFVVSAFIFLSTWLTAHKASVDTQKGLFKENMLAAVILLTVAIDIEYNAAFVPILYAFEGGFLAFIGSRYRKHYLSVSGIVVFALALLHTLVFSADFNIPASEFVPIFNDRASVFLILTGSIGLSGYLFAENQARKLYQLCAHVFNAVWITLLFIFFGLELSSTSTMLSLTTNSPFLEEVLPYATSLIIGATWVAYALPIIKYGLIKKNQVFKTCGAIIAMIGALTVLAQSLHYSPIEYYYPVLNLRFLLLAVTIGFIYTIQRWIRTYASDTNIFLPGLRYTLAILIFALISVEVNDLFNWIMHQSSGLIDRYYRKTRPLILSIVWMFFSLGFIKLAIARQQKGYYILGYITLLLATLFCFLASFVYGPYAYYIPGFNLRFFSMVVLALTMLIVASWIRNQPHQTAWTEAIINSLKIIASLLLFVLFSQEVYGVFQKEILSVKELLSGPMSVRDGVSKASLVEMKEMLKNMRQFAMSAVWLLYSISLMAVGIYKRTKALRYTAIALFGLTIFKIFVADLSVLEQPYRIFSFIGLGVILLAVSYMYQHFKDIINGEDMV